jgi:hypothetical protein
VGSSLFMALAPGTVAGLVPWWLTGWHGGHWWPPVRVAGIVPLLLGAVVLVHAFARFVTDATGRRCRAGCRGHAELHSVSGSWASTVRPPSTGTVAPVMKLASSDSRCATAAATSPGRPTLPTG